MQQNHGLVLIVSFECWLGIAINLMALAVGTHCFVRLHRYRKALDSTPTLLMYFGVLMLFSAIMMVCSLVVIAVSFKSERS